MSLLLMIGALAAAGPETPRAPEPTPLAAASATAPASTGVIRYDDAYFSEMRPTTAYEMILRLPGFALDTGAQVRGFAGAAGNVLVDGDRPTSKQDDLESILKRIPAAQVDHIEVIRGGAPGIDMQGRTVLANVVRRSAAGTSGVVAMADQLYTDGRHAPAIRLEMTRKWSDKTLELSLLPAIYVDDGAGEGPRVRTDPSGRELIRSDVDATAGGQQVTGAGAFSTPLWGGKFRINASTQYDHYVNDEDDRLIVPAGLETLRDRQTKLKGELGLHYERALGGRATLETLALQQFQRKTFRSRFSSAPDTALFEETDTLGESIGRAILRYRASPTLSAETSVEGAYNVQDSDSAFVQNGAAVDLPAARVKISEKRGEAAATATWRPDPRYTLEAGVRVEVSSIGSSGDVILSKTLVFPKPRVVFTWSPNPSNQLRLRVEREVGQLDFADFVATSVFGAGSVHAGNPDLEPANGWVGEVAYEARLKGAVLVVTARRQRIENVADRIPIFAANGDVFDAPGNIGAARENDLELNITLPLDRLGVKHGQLKATGTFRDSKVADPTTGEERRISGQHPFDYEIHFTQDLPRWRSTWGVDVFNRWTETDYRFDEIDIYKLKTWVTMFVEYKPNPRWSVRAEAGNVGSRGFQRVLKVYSGPRNTSPLQYIDNRRLDFGPTLYVRVRRTFG